MPDDGSRLGSGRAERHIAAALGIRRSASSVARASGATSGHSALIENDDPPSEFDDPRLRDALNTVRGELLALHLRTRSAWFLGALWHAGGSGGADLSCVIEWGDLQHSILTLEDIEHAVNDLLPRGLLDLREDQYFLTDLALELIGSSTDGILVSRDWKPWAAERIEACPHVRPVPNWQLDPAVWAAAYASYDARAQKQMPPTT